MADVRAGTIPGKDLPMARAAGAKVFSAGGIHYVEDKDVADAITVVRQIAYRTKKRPTEIMNRLADAGYVKAVGKFGRTGEVDSFEVNQSLAEICGVTFVMGPIKCHPDGRLELKTGKLDEWTPVTSELLAALRAETALGAKQTPAHLGAEVITKWREKK